MRKLLFLYIIAFGLSACALGTEPAREIQLTVIPIESTEELSGNIIESTQEPDITATFTPTGLPATSVPIPTSTPRPASIRNTTNCTVRSDLPVYRVVTGDTLSNIASRYSTTTAQLSDFNCLSDANLISVGMNLHVPVSATTTVSTVTPTPTQLGVRGTLRVFPSDTVEHPIHDTVYLLEAQTPVTIQWRGLQPGDYNGITSVRFILIAENGSISDIGLDNDMSDGIAITWTPPVRVAGAISASARTVNNAFMETPLLRIREEQTPLEDDDVVVDLGIRGTLGVFPVIEAGNPSDWTDYVIAPETSITINWTGIEPEYYADIVSATFFFVPDVVGASSQLGVDNDMSDGMSFTWTPRAGISGTISAVAQTANDGFWVSSTLHIRDN